MTGILEINFAAVLLILAILLIRAIGGRRLPKRFFASVWAVVLLRLIIPFSVPYEIDLFPPDYSFTFIDKMTGNLAPVGNFNESGEFEYYNGLTAADAVQARTASDIFTIVSLAVAAALLIAFTIAHLRNRKRYIDALPYEDGEIASFIKQYGLRRSVSVKYSDKISAPITYGVIKPVIVLPKSCAEESFDTISCILAHEMAHIRFFDVLYKWIITAVTCLYWYNPFVWLMFLLSDRDIEIACDMEAVNKCGCSRDGYSELLIGLEKKRSIDIYARSFSAGAIKKRIKAIMKSKKSGVVSIIIASVLSLCSFTVFASAHTGMETGLSMWIPIHIDNGEVDELVWLEPQKYYLEGGTAEQYIEVYPDKTMQVFGLDYTAYHLEVYSEQYTDYTEEEMAELMERLEAEQEYWNKPHGYSLLSLSVIMLDEYTGGSDRFFTYTDENTITISGGGLTYKAEKPWKAGIYQAYDTEMEPGFGYYYSDIDDSYIYMFFDVMEIYDGKGGSSGPLQYVQIKQEDKPGEVMLCMNADKLPAEEPRGYILNEDCISIYDPESGATYTLKSKPLFA